MKGEGGAEKKIERKGKKEARSRETPLYNKHEGLTFSPLLYSVYEVKSAWLGKI